MEIHCCKEREPCFTDCSQCYSRKYYDSGAEETKEGMNVDFDCALAAENMFVAAQGLGLGAHIYTGPIRNVKSNLQEFGIPTGFRPIAIIQIGHIENSVDAVSSASPRKTKDEVVNIVN